MRALLAEVVRGLAHAMAFVAGAPLAASRWLYCVADKLEGR